MLTGRQDSSGSTNGLGRRRKFGGALVEGWEGVGEKPTSRKEREKWGTHFYFISASDRGLRHRPAHHHGDHAAALRTQRHTNADL
jgi:hypothetical protein